MSLEIPKKSKKELDSEIDKLQKEMAAGKAADEALLATLISLVGEDDPRVKELRKGLGLEKTETESGKEAKSGIDTKSIAEEINAEAEKREDEEGKPLTDEEKQAIAREKILQAKEKAINEADISPEKKRLLKKTADLWKRLDDTRQGKVMKAGVTAAFLGTATIAAGALLGVAPSGGFLTRLGMKVGGATVMNMALTSNLTKKFFGSLVKPKENAAEKKGWKKELNWGNAASIVGIGGAFILSGGTVGAIAIGGFAIRKSMNAAFDHFIEKKLAENSEAGKGAADTLRRWKGMINGAGTIGVGLATMAALSHEAEVKAEEHQVLEKRQAEFGKRQQDELQKQEDVKRKLLEKFEDKDTKDAFRGEKVEFGSKGSIRAIDDLKSQITQKYPDLSQAPASVQEFMKGKSTEQAIKFGFFSPNDPSGAESALIYKGSSLELDKDGDVIFHDAKTGETHDLLKEKYGGKMFDSDRSAEASAPEGKSGERLINEYEDTSVPLTEPEIPMAQPADIPLEPSDSPHENLINEYEDTSSPEAKPDTVVLFDGKGYRETPLEKSPEGLAQVPMERIDDWVKSPANIYGLSPEQYQEAEIAKESAINHLFEGKSTMEAGSIDYALSMDAEILLDMKEVKEAVSPLHSYVNHLHEVTGVEPIGKGPLSPLAETVDEYIFRANQKAAATPGMLDKVRWKENDLESGKYNLQINKIEDGNTTLIEKTINVIDIPYTKQYGSLQGGKMHFEYDEERKPVGLRVEGNLVGLLPSKLPLHEDLSKQVITYSQEHNKDTQMEINKVMHQSRILYQQLAAYESIKDNSQYTNEAAFLKDSLKKLIAGINKYGNLVDETKLPEELKNIK